VLWGSADVNIDGQDVNGVNVSLVPGMTVTGRVTFDSSTLQPPTDLTRVRVNITPRGTQQGLDTGGLPPAQVDATGRFTVTGVPPGRYSINANAAAAIPPGTPGGRGGNAGGGAASGNGSSSRRPAPLRTFSTSGSSSSPISQSPASRSRSSTGRRK
jgi:hypothetical protein